MLGKMESRRELEHLAQMLMDLEGRQDHLRTVGRVQMASLINGKYSGQFIGLIQHLLQALEFLEKEEQGLIVQIILALEEEVVVADIMVEVVVELEGYVITPT